MLTPFYPPVKRNWVYIQKPVAIMMKICENYRVHLLRYILNLAQTNLL